MYIFSILSPGYHPHIPHISTKYVQSNKKDRETSKDDPSPSLPFLLPKISSRDHLEIEE